MVTCELGMKLLLPPGVVCQDDRRFLTYDPCR
jgi:hypothetical protein